MAIPQNSSKATPIWNIMRGLGRNKKGTRGEERRQTDTDAVFYDRSAVLVGEDDNGVHLNRQRQQVEGLSSETVEVSREKVLEPKRRFLTNFVKRMHRLKSMENDKAFQRLLSKPQHRHELRIYNELIGHDGEPDAEAIANFLSTGEGLELTQALEDQTRMYQMMGLALEVSTDPKGYRENLNADGVVLLGTQQGALNRIWNNMTEGQRNAAMGAVALAATGGAVGAGLVSGGVLPMGMLAGTAYGGASFLAGGAAGAGMMRLTNEGFILDVKRCDDMLNAAKSNAAEKKYMEVMLGVDPDDFEVRRGRVQRTRGRFIRTEDARGKLDQIVKSFYARNEYYKAFGINCDILDADPVQHIFRGQETGQRGLFRRRRIAVPYRMGEQVCSLLTHEMRQVFDPNKHFVDRNGNKPGDAGFNAGDLDHPKILMTYQKQRAKVMNKLLDRMVGKVMRQDADIRMDGDVQVLDAKIREFEDPARHAEAKKSIRESKDMQDAINTTAVDSITQIQNFMSAQKKLQSVREQMLREFGVTTVDALHRLNNEQAKVAPERIQELRKALLEAELEMRQHASLGKGIENYIRLTSDQFHQWTSPGGEINAALNAQPGMQLTQENLTTLSASEIMQRINLANELDPTVGWSEDANAEAGRLMMVYQVKAEALARSLYDKIAQPSDEFANVTGAGITEEELRTQSPGELFDRNEVFLNQRNLAPYDVYVVKREAEQRFKSREQALKLVLEREKSERALQHTSTENQRETYKDQIDVLNKTAEMLTQLEEKMETIAEPETLADHAVTRRPELFADAYSQLEQWNKQLARTPDADKLKPDELAELSIDELKQRIEQVAATTPGIGLDPDPNVANRFLLKLRAELLARQTDKDLFSDQLEVEKDLQRNNVSIKELRGKTYDQAVTLINRNYPAFLNETGNKQKLEELLSRLQSQDLVHKKSMITAIEESEQAHGDLRFARLSYARLDPDYKHAEERFQTILAGLNRQYPGVLGPNVRIDSAADVQRVVRMFERQHDTLRKAGDISGELQQVISMMDTYGDALRALELARSTAAAELDGAETIADIDRHNGNYPSLSEQEKERIQLLMADYHDARMDLSGAENSAAGEYNKLSKEMRAHYDMIIAINGLNGANITEDDLRNMHPEELMKLINDINQADSSQGWAKERNLHSETRQKLLYAMAEAHANRLTPAYPSNELANLLNNGLSEDYLVTAEVEEIISYVQNAPAAIGLTVDPNLVVSITNAKTEIRNRMEARKEGLQRVLDQGTSHAQELEAELAKPDDALKQKAEELKLVRQLVTSRGEMMTKMREVTRRATELLDTRKLSAADTEFSAVERQRRMPVGYVRLMQLMFNYQSKPDRDAQIVALHKMIPPKELAYLMSDSFRSVWPDGRETVKANVAGGGAGAELQHVFDGVQDAIKKGRISAHELRQFVRDMALRYNGKALAMTA